MPKPTPISPTTRAAISADIRNGLGRNATARKHNVAPGTVTNIARQEHLFFERCVHTAPASQARQIDRWAERVNRSEALWETLLATPNRQDGTEPRRVRKASYALYDLDRHHNGQYRSS